MLWWSVSFSLNNIADFLTFANTWAHNWISSAATSTTLHSTSSSLHYLNEVTANIGTSLVPSKGLCCYCLFYVLQNPIKLPNINFRNSMRTCNVKDHFGQTTFKITTRTFTHSQSEYTSFLVTIFAVIWDQFKRLQSNFLYMVVNWSPWWEDDVPKFPSTSRDVTHATTVVSDLTFMKPKRQICFVFQV